MSDWLNYYYVLWYDDLYLTRVCTSCFGENINQSICLSTKDYTQSNALGSSLTKQNKIISPALTGIRTHNLKIALSWMAT